MEIINSEFQPKGRKHLLIILIKPTLENKHPNKLGRLLINDWEVELLLKENLIT
jgi:hypothetical protein